MDQYPASRVSHRRDSRQRSAAPCPSMETPWEQAALQRCWMGLSWDWSCDLSIRGASRLRCEHGAALHTHLQRALRHQPQPDVCWLDLALCWRSAYHAKRVDGCISSSGGRAHPPGCPSGRAHAGGSVRRRIRQVPKAGSSIPLGADVHRQLPGTECMRKSEKTPSQKFSFGSQNAPA
jgi:hypothetical protein